MTTRIGIVLYPDAEELDWAGPYEVFGMAAQGSGLELLTTAESEQPVRSAKGLRVLPDCSFANAPRLHAVLVPGGQGSRVQMENPVLLEWLSSVAPRCSWVTSVCTGAAILCKAGLVGQREITTHWAYVATLRELAPEAHVRDDVRYVRDGRLVTAAGVSAGIDMALWLVGQILGEDHARQTRRFMQYDPQPPYS